VTAGASRWVGIGDLQRVFLYLSRTCGVVQMSIVQVVDVAVVLDSGMTATFTMLMIVMIVVVSHSLFSKVQMV
jgi:hypothetical protein